MFPEENMYVATTYESFELLSGFVLSFTGDKCQISKNSWLPPKRLEVRQNRSLPFLCYVATTMFFFCQNFDIINLMWSQSQNKSHLSLTKPQGLAAQLNSPPHRGNKITANQNQSLKVRDDKFVRNYKTAGNVSERVHFQWFLDALLFQGRRCLWQKQRRARTPC